MHWLARLRPVFSVAILFCGVGASAGTPAANPAALTEEAAIRLAVEHSPALAAALFEIEKAAQAVAADESLYPFSLLVDTNAQRLTSPHLSVGGSGVSTSTSQSVGLTAGVRKSFPTGTQLQLDVTGSVDHQVMDESAAGQLGGSGGPAYGVSGRLTVTQPLLRGFGKTVGEASLRQARLAHAAAIARAERIASELLRDVLAAYWELSYASSAVEIQRNARSLAVRALGEVQQRIRRGSVAPVEALTFETTLATRDEDLAQALDLRRIRAIALLRVLGLAEGGPDDLAAAQAVPPAPAAPPGDAEALGAARERALTLRELERQLDVAREALRIAGESERPRLDLSAWVQGEGLGDRSPGPAFEQLGTAGAGGAYVGLSFEMPLTAARYRAERAAAAAAVQVAERNLAAAARQLEADVRALVSQLTTADTRCALAAHTAALAASQLAAERRRYEVGTAIALQVQQAEDVLRQARLRLARAQVDRTQAALALDHLTGRLLQQHTATLRAGGLRQLGDG